MAIKKKKIFNFGLIIFLLKDGHFKYVEKHSSGITFGIGENGKLWILPETKNAILDNYKGSYIQTDEVECSTYENQRWNVIAGVMGLVGIRNGFTSIGFPTDRYNWSDEKGKIRLRKEDFYLPSNLCKWHTDWLIDFSVLGGADKEGWQYAFDFPEPYHAAKKITDYVRRRKWKRKYQIKMASLWREVNQKHRIVSLSLDQEPINSKLASEKNVIVWAVDSEGFVLFSLIRESFAANLKWQHVQSEDKFIYVSIGVDLKIWAIDAYGRAHFRLGVNEKNYVGTEWSLIDDGAKALEIKFKMLSVGYYTVWAVSQNNELYFRENVSKSLPEGTHWTKIDSWIKHVTVNDRNEVTSFFFLSIIFEI